MQDASGFSRPAAYCVKANIRFGDLIVTAYVKQAPIVSYKKITAFFRVVLL